MSIQDWALWLLLMLSVLVCTLAILTSSPFGFAVGLPSAAVVSVLQAKRGDARR